MEVADSAVKGRVVRKRRFKEGPSDGGGGEVLTLAPGSRVRRVRTGGRQFFVDDDRRGIKA